MHGTADVNGTTLWYELVGSGECVVQVGGAVSAHEGYATITPHLARHYEVLDYDHRGYGLSARPKQRYTIDVWCDDLVALLDHPRQGPRARPRRIDGQLRRHRVRARPP